MTEAEAKAKWCPFARVASSPVTVRYPDGHVHSVKSQPVSVNRGGAGSADEVRCLGSGCMAWRWRDEIKSASLTVGVVVTGKSAVDGWCGLAGTP